MLKLISLLVRSQLLIQMSEAEVEDRPEIAEDDSEGFFGKAEEEQDEKKQIEKIQTKHKKKHIKKRQKNIKKSRSSKEQEKEGKLYQIAQNRAVQIIEDMDSKYKEDLKLTETKKLACKKYKYIDVIARDLKNVYICDKFLEYNGLGEFEKWLSKIPGQDGAPSSEPSLALRKSLFQILLFLRIKSEHIVKAQQLQRIIQKHKRSQIKELRDLSEQIISKWSRLTYEQNQ